MTKEKDKNKKQKEKKSNLWKNSNYMISKLWNMDKTILFYCFLQIPFIVFLPVCSVYLPKVIVREVETKASVSHMLYSVGILAGATILLVMIQKVVEAKLFFFDAKIRLAFEEELASKAMQTDYQNIDRPSTLVKINKAAENLYGGINTGPQAIPFVVASMLANVGGFFIYTGILSSLTPWIALLVIGTTLINYFVSVRVNRWIHENKDRWLKIDNKLAYLSFNASGFDNAKDIRLYHMKDWLTDKFTKMMKERIHWTVTMQLQYFLLTACEALSLLLREGVAYAYLIYLVFANRISVSDFVLYFGVITGFSTWCSLIIKDITRIHKVNLGIEEYRDYVMMPDAMKREDGYPIPAVTNGSYEIKLEHVEFCYEGETKPTISDLNFNIRPGEKIAVVGANGAGKTTLVKLICGLYRPTKGRIMVGGHDISDYNIEEYYNLFSTVFQDIRFLPMTIEKNITLCEKEQVDQEKLKRCIQLSGLEEKIARLPRGLDTLLVKDINEDAVALSGGEEQKLMLAKALYKDSSIMILDEPTAALDPIAENEMYLKYHELTKDKTSIFISHRLASTRFCDRIILVSDGRILESGSHEELMAFGGEYAKMFDVQAKYYKEAKEDMVHA